MSHDLLPIPQKPIRIAIVIVLWGFGIASSTPWLGKIPFFLTTALVFGTYRRFRISPTSLKQKWTIGFIDFPHQNYKLRPYTYLEVVHEQPVGCLELILFGPFALVLGMDRGSSVLMGCGVVSNLAEQ